MKFSLSAPVRFRLIVLIIMLAGIAAKEAMGAQVQTLSRITAQQITKILQLPPGVTIYEPPAECDDPSNSRCSGMDRTKKLFTVSDDGTPQLSECGEMRLFRFAGIKHLNLIVSFCQQGAFTMPELKETKARAERVTEFFVKDVSRLNLDNSRFNQLRDARTVSINSEETAHIFTVLLFGHGVGLLPTAVVTSPKTTNTFVVQLFIVPEDRGPLMANLLPRTNEVMESLVKELYPATR